MNRSALTGSRNHLVNQLLFFDEQYTLFFDTYFPEQTRERANMEKIIQRYWEKLELLLTQDDELLASTLRTTVVAGSTVKITYEDDGLSEEFTIVFPTESDPDQNRISFLSPIGRQLLLASSGEQLTLETPVVNHNIRIEDVRLTHIGGFAIE